MENQFGSIAANAKNSFTYNLEDLELSGDKLWIRIDPKAGNREGINDYNVASGTLRLDNLHLVGIVPTSSEPFAINKLYYFLFHKTDGSSIQGVNDDLKDLNLQLDLKEGEYDVFFVINSYDADVLLAQDIAQASDLYISNLFSNKDADIFGYSGAIEVTGNMSINIILQRLYSQVKI